MIFDTKMRFFRQPELVKSVQLFYNQKNYNILHKSYLYYNYLFSLTPNPYLKFEGVYHAPFTHLFVD